MNNDESSEATCSLLVSHARLDCPSRGRPTPAEKIGERRAGPQPSQAHSGRRGGRLKEKVVENKKEEYKEYAQKIGTLALAYVPPDKAKLQQAFQQGNVKLSADATAGQIQLLITNYVKPNDSMTITFDKAAKAIHTVQIAS